MVAAQCQQRQSPVPMSLGTFTTSQSIIQHTQGRTKVASFHHDLGTIDKITMNFKFALADELIHAYTGVGGTVTLMTPATASPATTFKSSRVTNSRVPSPRSASAVAVTCAVPMAPAVVTLHFLLSAVLTSTVA